MTAQAIIQIVDQALYDARLAMRSPDAMTFDEADRHLTALEGSPHWVDQVSAKQLRTALGQRAVEVVNGDAAAYSEALYGEPAPRRITLDKALEWIATGFALGALAFWVGSMVGRIVMEGF